MKFGFNMDTRYVSNDVRTAVGKERVVNEIRVVQRSSRW